MILKLSLDLPDDVRYVPLTRRIGRGLMEYLNVVREDISDVETIVTELASNVIRHSRDEKGRFQVLLEFSADHVAITVVDAGHGMTFRDVPEVGSVRADLDGSERLGGFGLPMIDALSDRLEFRRTDPHGTTVYAEKGLRYLTESDAANSKAMNEAGAKISLSV